MKLAPLALTLALTGSLFAQTAFTDPANLRGERVKPRDGRELPIDTGTLGLQQLLRKLSTRASILNIVAHPDDEDGGMLTLYARGLGARVADLSLTRGEGGQNAMTGDFEDALGLLRTQELLANDRYTGVDQMFGTEVDFGFSKTKSEAFAKWTHDRVLYDAVRAIRLYRPLVITATFIGGVTDGHGQHQVSGQIAQEAFLAAGDPTIFPDMIAEGILPWQPLKVYARIPFADINAKGVFDYATGQYVAPHFVNYITGKVSTTKPSTDVVVPEGKPDPLFTAAAANPADIPPAMARQTIPLSYAQFSRIGLGLQKSQIGPGVRNAPPGPADSGYHLYGSCLPDSPTLSLCHIAADQVPQKTVHKQVPQTTGDEQVPQTTGNKQVPQKTIHEQEPQTTGDKQVAQGFSLGSHGPATKVGFSPQGMPSSTDPNFFTGIDTSIEAIATYAPEAFPPNSLATIANTIQRATTEFNPAHSEAIAPTLATALKDLDQLITTIDAWHGNPTAKTNALHELRIKRVQLNDALGMALGLSVDATAPTANLVASHKLPVHTVITTDSDQIIPYFDQELEAPYAEQTRMGIDTLTRGPSLDGYPTITKSRPRTEEMEANPSLTTHETRPYFFRTDIEQLVYQLRSPYLRNAPATPSAIVAWANLTYNGVDIRLGRIVHSGTQPLQIVPLANLAIEPSAQVLLNSRMSCRFQTELHPSLNPTVVPKIDVPKGWVASLVVTDVKAEGFTFFQLDAPQPPRPTITITGQAELPNHQTITEGYRPIGYGDLPRTNYYTPATTRIVPVDLQIPTHHHFAYLPGTGDAVPEALASIGLTPTILTVADLTPTNLAQYDTVILGVRTYNAHPDLHGAPTQALLDYARNGGNVVVQYQTPEFTAADAPYPLSLGANEKVVDETAPVELLAPTSTLLTTPNRITPADFNSWIEERGHGFLSTWDPHYTAFTETHDPGAPSENVAPQLPQRGGLITTPLGPDPKHQGRWTYVAFALYRQLPEAVPGAYRLFLNLLNP